MNEVSVYDLHYNISVRLANEKGYVINNVPGRAGDCLFDSVAYQLHSSSNEQLDPVVWRAMTVEYLRDNLCVDGGHKVNFIADNTFGTSFVDDESKWMWYLSRLQDNLWADADIARVYTIYEVHTRFFPEKYVDVNTRTI